MFQYDVFMAEIFNSFFFLANLTSIFDVYGMVINNKISHFNVETKRIYV